MFCLSIVIFLIFRKSGGGGGFKLALGTIVAGATGVVGYAYVDPEFRHKVRD